MKRRSTTVLQFLADKRALEPSLKRSLELWAAAHPIPGQAELVAARVKELVKKPRRELAPDGLEYGAGIPKWPQPMPKGSEGKRQ